MITERELATILAALRFWQAEGYGHQYCDIAEEHGKALDSDEIDKLAERLNLGDDGGLKALRAAREQLLKIADEAGDDDFWNKGGDGYRTYAQVVKAINKAEGY